MQAIESPEDHIDCFIAESSALDDGSNISATELEESDILAHGFKYRS
jgi:hypothetical protein